MNKTILLKNVSNLNQRERFDLIQQVEVSKNVLNYLKNKFQNLSIQILGKHEGNIIELMKRGLLEGWCWQTTESSVVFLEDDDYIERGNLKFETNKEYWHSWINFKFENKNFVFDPCLQIIVESSIYYHVFEITVEGKVTAKQVRDDLVYRINHSKKKSSDDELGNFLEEFFAQYRSEIQESEICVYGDNDVNSPMYRNNTGYNVTIENGVIKSLIAHYYLNG